MRWSRHDRFVTQQTSLAAVSLARRSHVSTKCDTRNHVLSSLLWYITASPNPVGNTHVKNVTGSCDTSHPVQFHPIPSHSIPSHRRRAERKKDGQTDGHKSTQHSRPWENLIVSDLQLPINLWQAERPILGDGTKKRPLLATALLFCACIPRATSRQIQPIRATSP